MQMIMKALSPDALDVVRKSMKASAPERVADELDHRLRVAADARAERDDRNRHERRRAAALERAGR